MIANRYDCNTVRKMKLRTKHNVVSFRARKPVYIALRTKSAKKPKGTMTSLINNALEKHLNIK